MRRIALTGFLLLLSSACSQLPRVELQAYRESFEAAESAAQPLIADYAAAERAQLVQAIRQDSRRTFRQGGYFADLQLDDAVALSPFTETEGAAALNRVFRGIELYNEALVALAEDRNVEVARAQLKQLGSEVTGIVPGLASVQPAIGPGADILANLLGPIVREDNRREFRRIVLDGQPLVEQLIDVLRVHAPPQYGMRVGGLLTQLQNEDDEDDEQRLIAEINGWHTAYANYVALLDVMKLRLRELNAAVASPRRAPVLERAVQGAADVRAYADLLRLSIAQIRIQPVQTPATPAQP